MVFNDLNQNDLSSPCICVWLYKWNLISGNIIFLWITYDSFNNKKITFVAKYESA